MSKMNFNRNNKSVFVSDLPEDTTEGMLLNAFSSCGQILSVRICRDINSGKGLGYGYVNFGTADNARHAVNTMNFKEVNGKQIRVMISQADPLQRKTNKANVFIKNLDKSIDDKKLFETFRRFGPIMSCKLAQEVNGFSKGFGFVCFEAEEDAFRAIQALNGRQLNGKTVFCSKFMSRTDRQKFVHKTYGNIYVKNLSSDVDDNRLKELFDSFGKVISAKVLTKNRKCYGFAALEDINSANNAVKALNGKQVFTESALYVSRAQKRVQKKWLKDKQLMSTSREGLDVYVKYVDNGIDEQNLKQVFTPFGTITSTKVFANHNNLMENLNAFGFGFISYSTPESAQKAVQNMNNVAIGRKPLFVAIAQTAGQRNRYLSAKQMQYIGGIAFNQSIANFPQMTF